MMELQVMQLAEAQDINLFEKKLKVLPAGLPMKVGGNFYCFSNRLTSLKGAPSEVGGNFYCFSNRLMSLEGAPSEVGGSLYCYRNQLTSLIGAPSKVGGGFYCHNNQLTSLEGGPSKVGGSFSCHNNRLTSLVGAPSKVGGSFYCHNNQLTSLDGAPSKVDGGFWCSNNQLTSLKNVHEHIEQINGAFVVHGNPIEDGWVDLLLIKGVTEVSTDKAEFDAVVNTYLKSNPSGSMKAVIDVQALYAAAAVGGAVPGVW